jgi:hypothetical protein
LLILITIVILSEAKDLRFARGAYPPFRPEETRSRPVRSQDLQFCRYSSETQILRCAQDDNTLIISHLAWRYLCVDTNFRTEMNYEIANSPCKITITVRARWNWWAVIGAPVVFAFWGYHATHSGAGSLSLPFVALLVGVIVFQMLWSLGGREVLCFGENQLVARRQIMFFSRSQYFPLREISEPFFIPAVSGGESDTPSGIGFDYLGTHHRFLDHLEEADVTHIVAMLRGTFPEIAKHWDRPNPLFESGGITTLGLSAK